MNDKKLTTISKFLSLVLRHQPQRIGLVPDAAGWVAVAELLEKAARAGRAITRAQLDEVVATNDKKRFALSDDGMRIRASQGHSIAVDLELPVRVPPDALFHGTASRWIASILRTGLDRRTRHHVHLTESLHTARTVGSRYGVPVILRVDARAMAADGHEFRCSDNGVWLVDAVPVKYLEVME
jgi:putative RNA 2'-phosphotransferase